MITIMKRASRRVMPFVPFASRLCGAHRRGHVAMVHIGRSGSTVLGDLLNQHPAIAWGGEIYQRIFQEREYDDHTLPPITDIDAVSYATEQARRVLGRYYGFELKFFHLRVLGADLASYLDGLQGRMRNLHVVTLERRNTLRMVVSTLAARETGVWHLKSHASARPNRLHLNVDAVFVNRANSRLIDLLQEFQRDFSDLKSLLGQRPSLHLTYEEDVAGDPRRAYAKICRQLDLAPRPAKVRFTPTNPYPLRDLIRNFDEVTSVLRGTDFEWMLEA